MKNTLADLNNHLFAQLERLSDEEITEAQLATEMSRAQAITGVAREVINAGHLMVKAAVAESNGGDIPPAIKGMLGMNGKN